MYVVDSQVDGRNGLWHREALEDYETAGTVQCGCQSARVQRTIFVRCCMLFLERHFQYDSVFLGRNKFQ